MGTKTENKMESNKQMASVASTLTAALASSVNANPKAGSAMVEVANKTGGGGKPKIGVFTTSFGVFKKVDVAKPQATAAETNVGVANKTVGVAKPKVDVASKTTGVANKTVGSAKETVEVANNAVGAAKPTVGVAKPPVPIKEYVPVPAPKIDAPKQTANSALPDNFHEYWVFPVTFPIFLLMIALYMFLIYKRMRPLSELGSFILHVLDL